MAKGSLSTHVLDTTTGKPAVGVRVELQRDGKAVASGVTDADGRIRELAADLEAGTYRLIFDPRAYAPDGFFSRVALDVELTGAHAHVPLLLSRFSVTSYRGS
jgi:5-hydroxyisourate hydrolase